MQFKPRCPECKKLLKRSGKSGFECHNPKCRVIKVFFDRYGKVNRVTSEGYDSQLTFGIRRKKGK